MRKQIANRAILPELRELCLVRRYESSLPRTKWIIDRFNGHILPTQEIREINLLSSFPTTSHPYDLSSSPPSSVITTHTYPIHPSPTQHPIPPSSSPTITPSPKSNLPPFPANHQMINSLIFMPSLPHMRPKSEP